MSIAPVTRLVRRTSGSARTATTAGATGPGGSCLLTTTGRTSGLARTSALACVTHGPDLVVLATDAGRGRHPVWYQDLLAQPRVLVQAGSALRAMTARTASGEERTRLWSLVTSAAGPGAAPGSAADRWVPVVVLEPGDGLSRPLQAG